MYFGKEYEKILSELIDMRIEYKLKKFQGSRLQKNIKEEILIRKQQQKDQTDIAGQPQQTPPFDHSHRAMRRSTAPAVQSPLDPIASPVRRA